MKPLFGLLLSASLLLAGCGKNKSASVAPAPAARPAAPVQAQQAVRGELSKYAIFTGAIEPVRVSRMASPAEGPIVECPVREGARVVSSQLLARVGRSRMAESNLDAAREELKRQQAEFRRVEQLVHSGSLAGEQLDIAQAALKRAEAQVAAAETGAADYEVRAPWDGIVSKVLIAEGNYVAPRAPLVELYDPDSLCVRFAAPEQEVSRLKTGIAVNVALDAYAGKTYRGVIERVFPQLEPSTRTLTLEARMESDDLLFSGLFARVAVPLETVENAVIIPSGALLAKPSGETVVFVAAEGRAVRRTIRVGLETNGRAQVLDGVVPGETVIVRGQENLKDGAPIKIVGPGAGAGSDPSSSKPAEGIARP